MHHFLLDIDSTVNRITFLVLLPFLVSFSFIVFIFYRRNRENRLRRKQVELELKAIRAQIHPHFIFNCLNSIHYLIQQKENDKAAAYLLKFSYLTRRILENSSKSYIALSEDLDILRAYLDLEQLRAGYRFTYTIHLGKELDTETTAVPMLIAQPLVENAVWHAFAEDQTTGKLDIRLDMEDDKVIIRIEDNGNQNANRQDRISTGKQKSMGKQLVSEQLEALSELEKRDASLLTRPLIDANGNPCGNLAEIHLPYIPFF